VLAGLWIVSARVYPIEMHQDSGFGRFRKVHKKDGNCDLPAELEAITSACRITDSIYACLSDLNVSGQWCWPTPQSAQEGW
jgi:hypothetical protein